MSILGSVRSQLRLGEEDASPIDLDTAFQVVRNSRRRHVVEYVADLQPGETVSLKEVSTYIASLEHDVEPDEVTHKQFKAVRNGLYQTHLPKLTDADAVTYERRSGELGRGETTDDLKDLIASARRAFGEDGGRR